MQVAAGDPTKPPECLFTSQQRLSRTACPAPLVVHAMPPFAPPRAALLNVVTAYRMRFAIRTHAGEMLSELRDGNRGRR